MLWLDNYKYQQGLRAELAYRVDRYWAWHDQSERVQIGHDPLVGRSALRRVYLDEGYVVTAWKNDDGHLSTTVAFEADCQPSTNIVTSSDSHDGTARVLWCNEAGDTLWHGANWREVPKVWQGDLDGFQFRASVGSWDLTPLDRELTLPRAHAAP